MTTLAEHLSQKPFSLVLSSGFFGFYAHAGVVSALEQLDLRPSHLAGSSAGAMVAGLWAGGVPADTVAAELLAIERRDFWDPGLGWGLLRGQLFHDRIAGMLVHQRMEDCRVPVAISAFDVRRRRTVVLDSGDLASAICASCAFPGLLQPVRRGDQLLSDGGIADRPGMAGAQQWSGRVLYHHLTSRSPWRRRQSPALEIPERSDMVAVRICGLPRANPFRLEAGRRALAVAKDAMLRALDGPVCSTVDLVT